MKKLILICILITALLLIGGCKKAVDEQPVTEPSVPVVVEPQEGEGNGAEAAEPGKILSALKCLDGAIEGIVTNTGDKELTLAKDIKVLINGLIVVDPECDKLVLAPGESVYCRDLSGHYAIRKGQVNRVQLNLLGERAVEVVDCAE